MATTTVYADNVLSSSCSNPSNSLGAIDNAWYGAPNTSTSCSITVEFPFSETTGSLNTGANLQSIGVYARKGSNNNNPTVRLDIRHVDASSGTEDVISFSAQTVSSTTASWFNFTWNAADLVWNGNPLSADGVLASIVMNGVSGSPSNRNSAEIDAVRWIVDYSASVSKFRLGDLTVSQLYVGDTRVRKAYLGDINIYS